MNPPLLRLLALTMAAVLATAGCGADSSEPSAGEDKPVVVASFYPLVFAAEGVGGDLVEVENLTAPAPSGAGCRFLVRLPISFGVSLT